MEKILMNLIVDEGWKVKLCNKSEDKKGIDEKIIWKNMRKRKNNMVEGRFRS